MFAKKCESEEAIREGACITPDHIDAYFECLTVCDLNDHKCRQECILVHLK